MPFKYTTKMLFMQAKLKRKHMLRMYFTYILNKDPKRIYLSFGDVIARGETKTLQKSYSEFSFAYYSLITE